MGKSRKGLQRPARLGLFARTPQLNRIGMPVVEEEVDAQDYISSNPPPPGFREWLNFARQNQCHLGPYTRILKDLEVTFSNPAFPAYRLEAFLRLLLCCAWGDGRST